MFLGLEHTALASPDPEKLAQWYVDYLGFRINYRYGGNVFVRAADGSMLEIIPGEGPRENQNLKTPGIRHLAVTVQDFDGAFDHLKGRGVNFITDKLETPDPDGAYGPYALGLSAYSDVLTEFAGGAGQVGIHGTNDPSVIGQEVSAGCIRLRNEDIERLVPLLPLGTPVEIVA